MAAKTNYNEDDWREFFKLCDKDGDGIVSRAEFMNSALPKNLKMAVAKRRELITCDEFLFEVNSYREQNLFMLLLNKWIQFIVPPKSPPLKPGCYQNFEVEVEK